MERIYTVRRIIDTGRYMPVLLDEDYITGEQLTDFKKFLLGEGFVEKCGRFELNTDDGLLKIVIE